MTLTLRGLLAVFAFGYVAVAGLFCNLVLLSGGSFSGAAEPTFPWTGFIIAMTTWTVYCIYVYFNNEIDSTSN